MNTNHAPQYFENIDLLRGFAALSVVVYHVIEHLQWKAFPVSGLLVWFRTGWMGVDLFFVISGFVIGLSAFSAIDQSGELAFRKPFIARRALRIVPLHYLTMMVFVVFVSPELLFNQFWINLLSHLLFLHNLHPNLHGAINGSNWSLATEMQFYALMLVLAPWIRSGRWWMIALIFVGVAWIWRWAATLLVPISSPSEVFQLFVWSTQMPGMLDEFVVGLLLAKSTRTKQGEKILSGGTFVQTTLFLLSAVALTVTMDMIYWRHASYWDLPLMVIFWRTLLAITFGLVLLFTISLKVPKPIKRILQPFYYLGVISYGIYLWHLPVFLSIKRLEWLSPSTTLFLVILLTCTFASMSWHFFEKPLMQKYRNRE
jgi:peptidoglycan/LPS O-acetylase OafA/YrhL